MQSAAIPNLISQSTPESDLQNFMGLDTSVELSLRLDNQSLGRLQQTSTFFNTALSKPYGWRQRLVRDFGLKMETLTEFEETAEKLGVKFKKSVVYKNLWLTKKDGNKVEATTFAFYPANHFSLLAVCAAPVDSPLYKYYIPPDENHFWKRIYLNICSSFDNERVPFMKKIQWAIQDNNLKAMRSLWFTKGADPYAISVEVIRAGSVEMFLFVQELLNPEIEAYGRAFKIAVEGGNFPIMQFLSEQRDLKVDEFTFCHALKAGNLEAIKFSRARMSDKFVFTQMALLCAVDSDKPDVFLWVLSQNEKLIIDDHVYSLILEKSARIEHCLSEVPLNRFKFKSTYSVLRSAALKGDVLALQWLLDPNNKFNLIPDEIVFSDAVLSGDLRSVEFLIQRFNFTLKREHLDSSCRHGKSAMARFLLRNSTLRPNKLNTLDTGDNPLLLEYLMDPENGFFEIDIDLDSLASVKNPKYIRILWSHANIKSAFKHLVRHEYKDGLNYLIESALYSLRQFFRVCVYACQHPAQFQLQTKYIHYLVDAMKKIASTYKNHITPIEFETIIALLEKASKCLHSANNPDLAKTLSDIADTFKQRQMTELVDRPISSIAPA